MDTLQAEETLTAQQMNSIKEKMSIAYMHAINSTVNYTFTDTNKDMDSLGIDLIISSHSVGLSRTVASDANMIYVQLKGVSTSSKSMITITDKGIEYTLAKPIIAIPTHYLVVVVLPDHEELQVWREIGDERLVLKAKAYYKYIDGTLKSGKVKIPHEDVLTEGSYKGLFKNASNKELI